MSEEPEEESFEEIDEDFEGEVGDDLDDNDIDLAEIDEDDQVDFDDDEDSPRGGGGGGGGGGGSRKDDDDMVSSGYEKAVVANPKRQAIQKKRARVIEGILDTAELSSEAGVAKAWQALQKQAGDAKPRKYNMKDDYTENDVVEHPSFGEGYVVEILTQNKMSVLFESGLRRLAQNK